MLKKVNREYERIRKKLFRSGQNHKQLEEIQFELDNMTYEIYDQIKRDRISIEIPDIRSIEETLDKIINEKCSISRFGDGEFKCINCSRIAYHDPSEALSKRLKEVLSSKLPKLLIGLSDCFGSLDCYVPYAQKFWRKYMSKKRKMIYSYLDMERVYYNAFLNRCYINFNKTEEYYRQCGVYFNKLKQIWKDRDVAILESQAAPLGVTNDILDGAKSISRVIFCPTKNAFNKYDQILSAFDKIDKNTLILAALGPSATVLAYDLYKNGYQAIDIGDINAEYECYLDRKTPLELKASGRECTTKRPFNPEDSEYKKQIIRKIE